MNVAHVVINGEVAGGQVIAGRIIDALRARGNRAILISSGRGAFTEKLEREGIQVYEIPFAKTYHIHHALSLLQIFRKEKVDIVHTHGMLPVNIPSRLASKMAGIPCFSHIHIANVFSQNPLLARYQLFLDRWTAGFCHQLIAVSQATKESLIRENLAPERIEVIPNGIDFDSVKPVKPREEVMRMLGIGADQRLVGMAGRLCPVKGQEELLHAMAQVVREIPDVSAFVIGKDMEFKGRYAAKLDVLTNQLGLRGRVIFAGHQSDPYSFINAADVFVLPSKAEGLPLVLLEAMALGKTIVASRVDGIPEVIEDGKTGLLVPPGDSKALARAILTLLSDRDASRLGKAAFLAVRNFDAARMCGRILELYDSIASCV